MSLISQSAIEEWGCKNRIPIVLGDNSETLLDQLVGTQLDLPGAPEPKIQLENIRKLLVMTGTLMALSFIILLYENSTAMVRTHPMTLNHREVTHGIEMKTGPMSRTDECMCRTVRKI